MAATLIIPVLACLEGEDASDFPAAWVRCRVGGKTLLERAVQTAGRAAFERVLILSDLPDVRREAKRIGVEFVPAPPGWDHTSLEPPDVSALGLRGEVMLLNPRAALVDASYLVTVAASLPGAAAVEVLIPVRQHPVGAFRPASAGTMDYSRTMDSDRWRDFEELRLWHFPRMVRGVNTELAGPTVWLVGDEASCLAIRSPLDARVAQAWLESPGATVPWRLLSPSAVGVAT